MPLPPVSDAYIERLTAIKRAAHVQLKPSKYLRPETELKPFQTVGTSFMYMAKRCVLGDGTGLGKAQPLDARVLTPRGWSLMGDLLVGDVITGRDGGPTRVTGVFPQGVKQIYQVKFSDGVVVECCGDHLWSVRTRKDKYLGKDYSVRDTTWLMENLTDSSGRALWFVPMVDPVQFEPVSLPLDPYLLGVILGDGGIKYHTVVVTSADPELVEFCREALPDGVGISKTTSKFGYRISHGIRGKKNAVTDTLRGLGLMGRGSHDKFIPEIYLRSSVGERVALLQGLLDTDGHIFKDGMNIEYTSVSEDLMAGVMDLVRSLGGTGVVSHKLVPNGPAYRVNLVLPNFVQPFRLSRKLQYWRPRAKYFPMRKIVSIRPVGVKTAQCISVSAPDNLYVTDGYVVTHNTIQIVTTYAHVLERHPGTRLLLVAPKSALGQLVKEFDKFTSGITCHMVDADAKFKKLGYTTKDAYREGMYRQWAESGDVMVINYASLTKDWHRFIKPMLGTHVLMSVFDEATAFKNRTSQTHKVVKDVVPRSDRSIGLTATIIRNKLEEAFNIYQALVPGLMPTFQEFLDTYCKYHEMQLPNLPFPVKKITGYKNLDAFRTTIDLYFLGRRKQEVADQLPVIRTVDVDLPVSKDQQRWLKTLDEAYDNEEPYEFPTGRETLLTPATMLNYEQQIVDDPRNLGYDGESPKLEWLLDKLSSDLEEEPVIIYAYYKGVLDNIQSELKAKGIKAVKITGEVSGEAREKAREDFQSGKVNVILINDAASDALNLQRAGFLVFFDLPWSYGTYAQLIGRAQRIGSAHGQVVVYHLLCHRTVDILKLRTIKRKLSVVENLFGDQGVISHANVEALLPSIEEFLEVPRDQRPTGADDP
jgi:hypothetical protein